MTDIELTRDWYLKLKACPEGFRVIARLNLLNQPYSKVIETLVQHNEHHCVEWIQSRIHTEEFVRNNGTIFNMKEQYRVFDPIIGQHIECVGETEARKVLAEVSMKILQIHGARVMQVLENENGDHAWIPTNISVSVQ